MDITKLATFHNSEHQRDVNHIQKQKVKHEKFGEIWVVDAENMTNKKYKPPKTGSKMQFTSHFYSLLMKKFTLVQPKHFEAF